MTDDRLFAFFCTACGSDFACTAARPVACPNCGHRYGGWDDDDE